MNIAQHIATDAVITKGNEAHRDALHHGLMTQFWIDRDPKCVEVTLAAKTHNDLCRANRARFDAEFEPRLINIAREFGWVKEDGLRVVFVAAGNSYTRFTGRRVVSDADRRAYRARRDANRQNRLDARPQGRNESAPQGKNKGKKKAA